MPAPVHWNRKPLPGGEYAPLPLPAIRPRGWLRDALLSNEPYDVDGRVAAGYLLDEKGLIAGAGAEMERVFASGGLPDEAAMRAVTRWHGATADKRAPAFMLRLAKELLAAPSLSPARAANLGDLLRGLLWLYNLTGQKALLSLCRTIKAQAPDWMSTFHVFPQTRPVASPGDPSQDAYWRVNGAAVAASLKTPALQALFEGGLKNETAFRVGWDKLMKHHGAAHGLFNADPLLAGAHPSRGVTRETVAALLYTLETLLTARGDPFAGDLLEAVTYNALPAAVGVQAANQLTPGMGKGAGGPAQFAASLWLACRDGGLAAAGYAPCQIRWRVAGRPVRLEVETDYPAEPDVRIRLRLGEPMRFPLRLRIPAWARGAAAEVPGGPVTALEPGTFAPVERLWRDGDVLRLTLPLALRTLRWYHQSVSVARGPVTFALPVTPDMPWNMALLPELGMAPEAGPGGPALTAHAAPVPAWGLSGGQAGAPPVAPKVRPETARPVRLIPYGRAEARVAQFPAGRLDKEEVT